MTLEDLSVEMSEKKRKGKGKEWRREKRLPSMKEPFCLPPCLSK